MVLKPSTTAGILHDPVFALPVAGQWDTGSFRWTQWERANVTFGGSLERGTDLLSYVLNCYANDVHDKRTMPIIGFFTTTDGHRGGASLSTVTAIGLDLDAGESFERLQSLLLDAGLAYIYYESTSDSFKCAKNPDGKRCWRLVLPLAVPIPATACGDFSAAYPVYKAVYRRVASVIWTTARYDLSSQDPVTCDPVRGWYPGTRPTRDLPPRRVVIQPGFALDGLALLAAVEPDVSRYVAPGKPSQGLGEGTPLQNEEGESIARHLAGPWRAAAGRRKRHTASLALGRLLRVGGMTREDTIAVVHRMAERAQDPDEATDQDRSNAAADGWDRPSGYGWRWLRKNLPEVAEAMQTCPHLKRGPVQNRQIDLIPDDTAIHVDHDQLLATVQAVVSSALPNRVEVIDAASGLLPTLARVAADRAADGLHTVILVRFYKALYQLHDELEKLGLGVRILLGVTALDRDGKAYCKQVTRARQLRECGFDVRRTLCIGCEFRVGCKARLGRLGTRKDKVTIGTHGRFGDVARRLHHSGVIIFDGVPQFETEKQIPLEVLEQGAQAAERQIDTGIDLADAYRTIRTLARSCTEKTVMQASDLRYPQTGLPIVVKPMWDRRLRSVAGDGLEALRWVYPVLQTMIDPHGVFEFQPAEVKSTLDSADVPLICSFRNPSLLLAMKHLSHPLVVIGDDFSAVTIHQNTGREVRVRNLVVNAPAPIERIFLQASNGTRGRLIRDGRVDHSKLVGILRRVVEQIEEYPPLTEILDARIAIVTHTEIVDDFIGMVTGDPIEADDAWFRAQEVLLKFRKSHPTWTFQFAKFHGPMDPDLRTCNVFVTIGDPWPNVPQAKRRLARSGGGSSFDHCRDQVRNELGRILTSPIYEGRTCPALLIHCGEVGPREWVEDHVQERMAERGRPPRGRDDDR